ncbi:hypothetical protein C2I36_09510 [Rhodobacteraceae bacterium WD3A24]|nr:hypothetical protein C2I36_09510 [Rhodobacteraceae bacterium WD3A24]
MARVKRHVTIQQALEWAFRRELASLELPRPTEDREGFGFGMEYIIIERARLGTHIDGGGPRGGRGSCPHEDAEVIAAAVSNLPDSLGGKRMAIRIAELARAGMAPDWMPGAIPRIVPVEKHENQYGWRSGTEVVGTVRYRDRGRGKGRLREVEVRACPVTLSPDPRRIDAVRLFYTAWREALVYLAGALREGGMLREHEITDGLPPGEPWV